MALVLVFFSSPIVERNWGTRKYASFMLIMLGLCTASEFILLFLGSRLGLKSIPAGPFSLTMAIVYQSTRLTPPAHNLTVFSIPITTRLPLYVLCLQLICSQTPTTILLSLLGILSSYLYRSIRSLNTYRISNRLFYLLGRVFSPILGTEIPVRRGTAAVFQDPMRGLSGGAFRNVVTASGVMGTEDAAAVPGLTNRRATTTPTPAPAQVADPTTTTAAPAAPIPPFTVAAPPSFVEQWTRGITGSTRRPTAEQVAELSHIFPHSSAEAITTALQQSNLDVARAAELLLSGNQ